MNLGEMRSGDSDQGRGHSFLATLYRLSKVVPEFLEKQKPRVMDMETLLVVENQECSGREEMKVWNREMRNVNLDVPEAALYAELNEIPADFENVVNESRRLDTTCAATEQSDRIINDLIDKCFGGYDEAIRQGNTSVAVYDDDILGDLGRKNNSVDPQQKKETVPTANLNVEEERIVLDISKFDEIFQVGNDRFPQPKKESTPSKQLTPSPSRNNANKLLKRKNSCSIHENSPVAKRSLVDKSESPILFAANNSADSVSTLPGKSSQSGRKDKESKRNETSMPVDCNTHPKDNCVAKSRFAVSLSLSLADESVLDMHFETNGREQSLRRSTPLKCLSLSKKQNEDRKSLTQNCGLSPLIHGSVVKDGRISRRWLASDCDLTKKNSLPPF